MISSGLPPKPADFSIKYYSISKSADSNVNIAFMWDKEFNVQHAIESYHITSFSDKVLCPMSCPFDRLCVCVNTGQLPKEGVTFTIYAINCEHQMGANTTHTILPQGIYSFYISMQITIIHIRRIELASIYIGTVLVFCKENLNDYQLLRLSLPMLCFIADCQTETLGNFSNQTESICGHNSTGSVLIPNGVGCFEGNFSGSLILYYQCDEGYTLTGNTNRTCLSDGNWSGEKPKCQIPPCKWHRITLLHWY